MKYLSIRHPRHLCLLSVLILTGSIFSYSQQKTEMDVGVDASEAGRNVFHITETINVRPGRLTLFYPKWIPGEHSPTGTLNDMVNLRIVTGGKPAEWVRDDVEMFAFHLTVPAGADQVFVNFDYVSQMGTIATADLARIKWNRLLLYPRGQASDQITVSSSLRLPAGWKYATALPVKTESGETVVFNPVTLTTFIDSPAIIGRHFKKVPLSDEGILHEMDIAADTDEALNIKPETLAGWKNLVKEASLMYGARHYGSYRFLLTLSDYGGSEGLEHHESSEDGTSRDALSDQDELIDLSDLLGHEYTHSWNGKFRRPAELTTSDFEQPMHGELLWVYEGLTEYLGNVLPARSHLWTPEIFRETVADVAATMDNQTGRRWRSVVDTARAVQFTYPSPNGWMNERRRVDYYFEGLLVWMEADVLIRQKSGGRLSLDNFLQEFHGGQNTGPVVKTYTLADVIASLNKVLPYDWNGFFKYRIYEIRSRAPLGGITDGGWTLVYTDAPNVRVAGTDRLRSTRNYMYSVGMKVDNDGTITDVNPDLAAYKAGLAPGMVIVRDDEKSFSNDDLANQIAAAKTSTTPIMISVLNSEVKQQYSLDYHGGARYPHLKRDETKPDILAEIIKGH